MSILQSPTHNMNWFILVKVAAPSLVRSRKSPTRKPLDRDAKPEEAGGVKKITKTAHRSPEVSCAPKVRPKKQTNLQGPQFQEGVFAQEKAQHLKVPLGFGVQPFWVSGSGCNPANATKRYSP